MKQQFHLASFLLTSTIVLCSLTKVRGQKVPVRKPAAKIAVPKAQGLTMQHFINIDNLIYLPSVDEYLTARNWRFAESEPGEENDKVYYKHKLPNGATDAYISIAFCNQASNDYCFNPAIHDGRKSQHVYSIIYIPSKAVYDKLKAEVKSLMEPTSSITGENKITTVFKGDNYTFGFTVNTSDGTATYIATYQQSEEDSE